MDSRSDGVSSEVGAILRSGVDVLIAYFPKRHDWVAFVLSLKETGHAIHAESTFESADILEKSRQPGGNQIALSAEFVPLERKQASMEGMTSRKSRNASAT
jgi:hypothetical protein